VTGEFPPKAEHPEHIVAAVAAFASVVEGRTAIYVSSPLTTGRRAFEWHLKKRGSQTQPRLADSNDFHEKVIEPNRVEAAAFVRKLREDRSRVIIDPTAMNDLAEWTQADYRVFWGRVIELYAAVVVFRDGWMFSSGCVYEFFVAWSSRAQLLSEDFAPLSVDQGRSLIAEALEVTREKGASTDFLGAVLDALDSYNSRALGG
jgi:hypothetical protein